MNNAKDKKYLIARLSYDLNNRYYSSEFLTLQFNFCYVSNLSVENDLNFIDSYYLNSYEEGIDTGFCLRVDIEKSEIKNTDFGDIDSINNLINNFGNVQWVFDSIKNSFNACQLYVKSAKRVEIKLCKYLEDRAIITKNSIEYLECLFNAIGVKAIKNQNYSRINNFPEFKNYQLCDFKKHIINTLKEFQK